MRRHPHRRIAAAGVVFAALAGLAGLAALLLQATGQGHVLTAVRDTYLRGRLTPPITLQNAYLPAQVRPVPAGVPQPWPLDPALGRRMVPPALQTKMAGYRTAAFIVIRHGALLHESYASGFGPATRTNSNSVAKSWLSALVGAALAEGHLRSLDQPVGDFVEAFRHGPRARLTLRHLLTMSAASGFDENYDDPFAFPARAHYGRDLERLLREDFHVEGEPGRVHKYDSASSALLGLVLTRATGMALSDYLSRALWQPLGAEQPASWALDREGGFEKGYCCLYATARDHARLGQLFLQHGRWNGRQLLPPGYATAAVAPAPLAGADGQPTQRYGYAWWRTTHAGHAVFYAWGYQGQYVAVVPALALVVVRLGDGGGYTQQHHVQDLPLYLDAALAVAAGGP